MAMNHSHGGHRGRLRKRFSVSPQSFEDHELLELILFYAIPQKDTNALEAVGRAKIPMLFFHGGSDKFVPTYMVNLLFDACSAPYKDKLIVEGADHAESYLIDKEACEKKMDEFIKKFIK